jgi:hypothetical protein
VVLRSLSYIQSPLLILTLTGTTENNFLMTYPHSDIVMIVHMTRVTGVQGPFCMGTSGAEQEHVEKLVWRSGGVGTTQNLPDCRRRRSVTD